MDRKLKLLDLFCGAGGAGYGYHLAGFEVVGVDIEPQPDYPFEFIQADAMTFPLDGFDAIHASPPCHDHSTLTQQKEGSDWMLQGSIDRLRKTKRPWVVENVLGSYSDHGTCFMLCGSMFGMQVRRHRWFRSSFLMLPPPCAHGEQGKVWTITGHGGSSRHSRKPPAREFWRYMNMPWMKDRPHRGVTQAIPPAYTAWIGKRLAVALDG